MKGSRFGSALQQTRNKTKDANLLDIALKEDVSSQPKQYDINNIISGSSPSDRNTSLSRITRTRAATAIAIQTKSSFSSSSVSTTTGSNLQFLNSTAGSGGLVDEESLLKPKSSHFYTCTQQPKPRPEHPLPLISFPSSSITPTPGNNDPDNNEVVTPTPTISANSSCAGKLGRISTKELLWKENLSGILTDEDNFQIPSKNVRHSGQGGRDGWIASDFGADFHRAKTSFYNRVPKTSHSAKKLAKPFSILIPPNSSGWSYSNSYGTGRGSREVGNSPSATSNTSTTLTPIPSSASSNPYTVDNTVVNKPKRNKTARAETGLRKGLTNSFVPNLSKRGLLFFSDAKKVEKPTTVSKVGKNSREENDKFSEDMERQGQQSSYTGPSSGLRLMSGEGRQWKDWEGPNTGIGTLTKSSLSKKLNERVQVVRTAEERERCPESIRLDGLGLKLFPYIGGEECIKLLSLQKNLINHLDNTPSHLSHLVVLDLYSNKIERLTGLLGFTSLRVLLLGKNKIRRIEGLENLKRLEILDLHGNQLRYVDNLGVLSSLRILNLAGNLLRSIRNLGPVHGLTTLIELNLKRNRIRNLDGLVKAPNLKKLLLASNDLQSFSSLLPLRKLSSLEELLLEPNPLTSVSDYRHQTLTMLPWLECMDRVEITEIMRSEARQWQKRKLAEEEERRKEEAQLRAAASPTGGPLNSREQAIYQAQRRWETVKKKFVKNTNSKPTNPSSPSLLLSEANETRTLGKDTEDKIGTGGPVRSEIDEDLKSQDSHFRSESRLETLSQPPATDLPKESKSNQNQSSSLVLLEYPGGELTLNLAHLDLDLDQHHQPTVRTILDGSEDGKENIKRMPMPPAEESCPPSMINDLGPPRLQNGKDYINSSDLVCFTKQIQDKREEDMMVVDDGSLSKEVGLGSCPSNYNESESQVVNEEIGVATQARSQMKKTNCGEVKLLSSKPHDEDVNNHKYNSQMDSSIITNIIKEVKSTQSPPRERCQPQWTMLTQILGAGNDDDSEGHAKMTPQDSADTFSSSSRPQAVVPSSTTLPNINNHSVREREMKIAVVRPLVREQNKDETNINSPPNDFLQITGFGSHSSDNDLIHEQNKMTICNVATACHVENVTNFSERKTINWDNKFSQNNNEVVESNIRSKLQQSPAPNHNLSPSNSALTLPAPETKGKVKTSSHEDISSTDTNQFPSITSPSDSDRDKIIQSNKSEIMPPRSDMSDGNTATSYPSLLSSGAEECGNVTSQNMLKQNFPTCLQLPGSNSTEEETTCPTFTFETLYQQSINKEETRIINNNLTAFTTPATTTTALPTSANILQASVSTCNISLPTSSLGSANANASQQQISNITDVTPESGRNYSHMKPSLRKLRLRSASFDFGRLLSSSGGDVRVAWDEEHYDVDDDDTCSITTSTTGTGSNTTIATSDVSPRNRLGFSRKQLFPRTKSQRLKLLRDRPTRAQSSSSLNTLTRTKSGTLGTMSSCSTQNVTSSGGSVSGVNRSGDTRANKTLRRCESAVVGSSGLTGAHPLENNVSPAPLKRCGIDYLVEIDGKVLSIYGQGALKHTLTGFSQNVTCSITTAKFHYISYDSIIPFFGKMRQIYPFLEHIQFRANNIETLSQLNSLSDLQGLTSLHIAKEGNPLVSVDCSWVHYANYRLSHWGLKNVNGKEVSSEYRGGQTKCFESLGFLALSCLPQTALTPLARRLHMLHCFCCCSPSSSSDESVTGKAKVGKPGGVGSGGRTTSPLPPDQSSFSGNICTSWDDDPVLLDVIGKEALVYCPSFVMRREISPPPTPFPVMYDQESPHSRKISSITKKDSSCSDTKKRQTTLNNIVESGIDVLEKLDRLEKVWPSLMTEMIQDILLDYKFMDNYMKKELKKCQNAATIALHKSKGS